jgi:hypothetical protein
MSYKDELKRRELERQKSEAQASSELADRRRQLKDRIDELVGHLQDNGVHDVGVNIEVKDGAVTLDAGLPRFVKIVVDLENYLVSTNAGSPSSPVPQTLQQGTERRLRNLAEVDDYLLSFLEETRK